jgi:hypothetical protein
VFCVHLMRGFRSAVQSSLLSPHSDATTALYFLPYFSVLTHKLGARSDNAASTHSFVKDGFRVKKVG